MTPTNDKYNIHFYLFERHC